MPAGRTFGRRWKRRRDGRRAAHVLITIRRGPGHEFLEWRGISSHFKAASSIFARVCPLIPAPLRVGTSAKSILSVVFPNPKSITSVPFLLAAYHYSLPPWKSTPHCSSRLRPRAQPPFSAQTAVLLSTALSPQAPSVTTASNSRPMSPAAFNAKPPFTCAATATDGSRPQTRGSSLNPNLENSSPSVFGS